MSPYSATVWLQMSTQKVTSCVWFAPYKMTDNWCKSSYRMTTLPWFPTQTRRIEQRDLQFRRNYLGRPAVRWTHRKRPCRCARFCAESYVQDYFMPAEEGSNRYRVARTDGSAEEYATWTSLYTRQILAKWRSLCSLHFFPAMLSRRILAARSPPIFLRCLRQSATIGTWSKLAMGQKA